MDTPKRATSSNRTTSAGGSSGEASGPSSWPGAFGVYAYSRDAVRRNIGLLLEVIVVYLVLAIVLSLTHTVLARLVIYAIGIVVSVMTTRIFLAGARGQKLSEASLFDGDLMLLTLKFFALDIMIGAVALISILLFIVPFFFIVPKLVLAPYYLIDQNMGPVDAFMASWKATNGHVGEVWGTIGVNLLMALLSITIIGIPFTIYFSIMYSAARVILYLFLKKRQSTP